MKFVILDGNWGRTAFHRIGQYDAHVIKGCGFWNGPFLIPADVLLEEDRGAVLKEFEASPEDEFSEAKDYFDDFDDAYHKEARNRALRAARLPEEK